MIIAKLMKKNIITIKSEESLGAAASLMKEKKIRHLPVVDGSKKIVGIITDRDLKRASASDATLLEVHELLYLMNKVKLSTVMTKKPITISPSATLEKAAELFVKHKIGCLPVVDNNKIQGILTHYDLLSHFAKGGGKATEKAAAKTAKKPAKKAAAKKPAKKKK